MSGIKLKLNEALLSVNRINISNPVDIYYQLEECYGCPPEKLTPKSGLPAENHQEHFVINTQRDFHLELRQIDSSTNVTRNWCTLNDITLNSYGQYKIDVNPLKHTNAQVFDPASRQSLNCVLSTIDSGECLLCPFAILICILFSIVGLEQFYTRFWSAKRDRRNVQDDSLVAKVPNEVIQQQEGVVHDEPSAGQQSSPQDSPEAFESDQPNRSIPVHILSSQFANGSQDANESPRQRRLESLDIFRGFTLAGMIFVNYGGAGYAILEHKAWNGITLADFVFPFFIFSMGASVAISAKAMVRRHKTAFHTIVSKIFRRALILALLGVCLNSKVLDYDRADGLAKLRLTGVLQRFSISYLVIALMYTIELTISRWTRAQSLLNVPYLSKLVGVIFELLTAINYGAIHVYLTFYFDYDANCPAGYIGPGGLTEGGKHADCTGGAAAWIDRFLLSSSHIYNDHEVKEIFKTKVSHDPEGILGYTTSILLTLVGLQCGKILISRKSHKQKLLQLGQWALAMALASTLIVIIPINKRLWSLTFVSVTALAAFITVILLYTLVDIYSCKQSILIKLLSSAGKNSIFLYVGHSLIFGMLPWWFPVSEQATHLQLLLRLSWSTFVWLWIAHFMAVKQVFVKV